MRTLDPKWLSANPVDESAKISSDITIPASVEDVQNNQDGTRPKVTIDLSAEFYMDIITLLQSLSENQDMLQEMAVEMMAHNLIDHQGLTQDKVEAMTQEEFLENALPAGEWHDYELHLGGTAADDREMAMEMKISAPAPLVGMHALVGMAQPDRLQQLAIALSPTVEDDDDEFADPNEVLVVD